MKKNILLLIISISFLLLTMGVIFISNFQILENKEVILFNLENEAGDIKYEITSYSGNAATSSTLKLYEIVNQKKKLCSAYKTQQFFDKGKIIEFGKNDQYKCIIFSNGVIDTIQVDLKTKVIFNYSLK